MSTKSNTAMDTNEAEVRPSGRPVRSVKPVSYNEGALSKRGPVTNQASKESSSEPKDKKKKKINGKSNDDAPTKKSGKAKADAKHDEDAIEQEDVDVDDDPMPDAKQPDESKSVAGKAGAASKKPSSRKEKQVADPKPPIRRKPKDTTEETNGETSSKPTESKEAAPKAANGKSATSKAAKGGEKAATVDAEDDDASTVSKPVAAKNGKGKKTAPVDSENGSDSQEDTSKPVAVKNGKGTKTAAGNSATVDPIEPSATTVTSKTAPIDSENGSESPDEASTKPATSKGKSRKAAAVEPPAAKTSRGKKAVKESSEAADGNGEAEASSKTGKGRPKKAVSAKVPDAPIVPPRKQPRGTKRKPSEPLPNSVIRPKLVRVATPTNNVQSPSVEPVDAFKQPAKESNLKISTWNVAGLRAWVKKEGLDFLNRENPDIFCLQETKCVEEEVPSEAQDFAGFHKYWHGMKGGQAGVALYTKIMPYDVTYGINDPEMDAEARLLTAHYTKFYLVCVYVPNSSRKLVNLDKRMRWDAKFQSYLAALNAKKPVIVCGDMNVAHLEIDLANPKTNRRNAGFTQEERDGMTKMLENGFIDAYRQLYPKALKAYTFWTYMSNARAKNLGWRLDYFILSERLGKHVVDVLIRSSVLGSDHCPLTLFLNI